MLPGGVVALGADGRHVHAVDVPYGGVAAVEVAAIGARRHVVGTLVSGPLAVDAREKPRFYGSSTKNITAITLEV